MPEEKSKYRLESSVVVPRRSSQKRSKAHSDSDSDGERHGRTRKERDQRRQSPEYQNRPERSRHRLDKVDRGDLRREPDEQPRSLLRRITDLSESVREVPAKRSNTVQSGLRYTTLMDLDPSDVPRGGKYFLHDNRESGASFYPRQSFGRTRRRETRRGTETRGRRRSQSPVWKHDKFEEIEAEDSTNEASKKNTKLTTEDKR